jgi:hypothetical protein
MNLELVSKYLLAILLLPISVATVRNVIAKAATIFDDDLTIDDRASLKQLALFVLLPLVVLFHELGHALAARFYGAQIVGFHWSLFWGRVIIQGQLTPFQDYVISLAGNVFQLAACLFALSLTPFQKSPAMVALSVYFFLFAGFSCLIGYPLLSIINWNDDFSVIYGIDDRVVVTATGAVHFLLALAFVWAFLSQRTRLWFTKKTRPSWWAQFIKIRQRAKDEPDGKNLLALAWQYYVVGLDKLCEETMDKAQAKDPELLDVWLLRGFLHQSKGRYRSALLCFQEVTDSPIKDPVTRTRAWMARGHCLTEQMEADKKKIDWPEVLQAYKAATECQSNLLDPYYYLGATLVKANMPADAEAPLNLCQNGQSRGLSWFDPTLPGLVQKELTQLRSLGRSKQ